MSNCIAKLRTGYEECASDLQQTAFKAEVKRIRKVSRISK